MENEQPNRFKAAVILVIIASIPNALILIGIAIELIMVALARIHPGSSGVVNVTIEYLVFRAGLYLALPCGGVSLIAGSFIKSSPAVNKKIAIIGRIIGILGVLMGILALIWFAMISAIQF